MTVSYFRDSKGRTEAKRNESAAMLANKVRQKAKAL